MTDVPWGAELGRLAKKVLDAEADGVGVSPDAVRLARFAEHARASADGVDDTNIVIRGWTPERLAELVTAELVGALEGKLVCEPRIAIAAVFRALDTVQSEVTGWERGAV